jgi:hypothetical protein
MHEAETAASRLGVGVTRHSLERSMRASQIIAFSLVVVLVGSASAAMAKLVRQYVGATPGGEPVLVCEYSVDGRVFEERYPIGNFCPMYAEAASGERVALR